MAKNDIEKNLNEAEKQVIAHSGSVMEAKKRFHFCFNCCNRGQKKQIIIPKLPAVDKKLLILDLDETLIHCSFYPPSLFDFSILVTLDGHTYQVFVQKRPNVDEFISEVLSMFQVYIFTASIACYANPIIDRLWPSIPKDQRLFRENCSVINGLYVKRLEMFSVDLKDIIIIDNNPCSFALNPENAILSDTWEGDMEDKGLTEQILPKLKACYNSNDVRVTLKQLHTVY